MYHIFNLFLFFNVFSQFIFKYQYRFLKTAKISKIICVDFKWKGVLPKERSNTTDGGKTKS